MLLFFHFCQTLQQNGKKEVQEHELADYDNLNEIYDGNWAELAPGVYHWVDPVTSHCDKHRIYRTRKVLEVHPCVCCSAFSGIVTDYRDISDEKLLANDRIDRDKQYEQNAKTC